MKKMLRLELKKALTNKFFLVTLAVWCVLALLSAIYMIENYGNFNPQFLDDYFLRDGELYENPYLPLTGFYTSWIGGESLSLVYSVFYTLLPVAAALPFAWSFFTERQSGYIKNIAVRAKKLQYFVAKAAAVFLSGMLLVLIALVLNLFVVSAFLPVYQPEVNYVIYTHVNFGELWANLYYVYPFLFVILYVLLTAVYGGIFALLSLAVTFYIRNRFAVLLLPFLLLMGLQYVESAIAIQTSAWYMEIVPTSFLHSTAPLLMNVGWIILLEAALFLAFSLLTVLLRGKHDEIY